MESEKNNSLESRKPSSQERLQDGRTCTTCNNFYSCWDIIGDKAEKNLWTGQPKTTGECSTADGLIKYEPASPESVERLQLMIDNSSLLKLDFALQRADSFFYREDYDTAILEYNDIIRLYPDYARAYFKRGDAYFLKGDYDKAIKDFNQTENLIPAQRPTIKGPQEFQEIIKKDLFSINESHLYLYRGNAYKAKGDTARAEADYAKAKELEEKEKKE